MHDDENMTPEVIAIELATLAVRCMTAPWTLFGATQEEWDALGPHERGEDLDHFLDQNPEVERIVTAVRAAS
jgi:hypothetical protein